MEDVIHKTRIALFALLLAPSLSFAQSLAHTLAVHGPFDPATYKPLDGHERWQRWVNEDGRSSTIHLKSLATAAYMQVIDSPSEWKGTTNGFALRLGSSYGSSVIQNSVHESMAGIAGTDPRYFPCACTGLVRRSGHALKMTFLTYNRSGHQTLDIPQLSGAYGSSMISTMWYPDRYSPLVQGVQSGHIEVGIIGAKHIVQEFSPELKRFFHLHFGEPATTP
jgi:hypothetical protein